MWLIFEIFGVLFKMCYLWLESVFRAIVRPPKKNIDGQIVLITGWLISFASRETMQTLLRRVLSVNSRRVLLSRPKELKWTLFASLRTVNSFISFTIHLTSVQLIMQLYNIRDICCTVCITSNLE